MARGPAIAAGAAAGALRRQYRSAGDGHALDVPRARRRTGRKQPDDAMDDRSSSGVRVDEAAATATTILVAEKIRKKYPRRAALFMAGVNTACAFVVLHNYRATRSDTPHRRSPGPRGQVGGRGGALPDTAGRAICGRRSGTACPAVPGPHDRGR